MWQLLPEWTWWSSKLELKAFICKKKLVTVRDIRQYICHKCWSSKIGSVPYVLPYAKSIFTGQWSLVKRFITKKYIMFDLLKMLLAPLIWNWNKYKYFPLKITLNFIYICKCIYKKLFSWVWFHALSIKVNAF